jgi:ribonuclease Z
MLKIVRQSRISKIFISHFHGDHYLGVLGLLLTMSLLGRTRQLDIYGPEGCKAYMGNYLASGHVDLSFDVCLHELDSSCVVGPTYDVISFPVDHGVPALGFVFREHGRRGQFDIEKAEEAGVAGPMFHVLEQNGSIDIGGRTVLLEDISGKPVKGKKITYSGDTAPIVFPQETKGSTLLIHEATFLSDEDRGETFHSTVRDAVRAAANMGARQLVLTHINARYTDEEVEAEAHVADPSCIVARDYMEIEL